MNDFAASKNCGALSFPDEDSDLRLQNAMMSALHSGEFFICLQPKFSFPDRRIVGAEALLRWNEADGGILFPSEFIPAAVHAGLVELLDLYALEEACMVLRDWLNERKPAVPLSINLSPPSMHTPGFIDAVSACVMRYMIPHDMLEFEFATSFMRAYPEKLSSIITYFHDLGFRCAIDGFQQGPAVLPHVRTFEIDTLKLDCRSFVPDDEAAGLLACMQAFQAANGLGMDIILEGVETPFQLNSLADAGVGVMQGYALSMPVSKGLFARMLGRNG